MIPRPSLVGEPKHSPSLQDPWCMPESTNGTESYMHAVISYRRVIKLNVEIRYKKKLTITHSTDVNNLSRGLFYFLFKSRTIALLGNGGSCL
jgi:hypothetical protein